MLHLQNEPVEISLLDLSFFGDECSSRNQVSKHILWDRQVKDKSIVVFTDLCLAAAQSEIYKSSKKIAWLIEPEVIFPQSYQFVNEHPNLFDLVLTHHVDKVKAKNVEIVQNRMIWLHKEDWQIYPKSKHISIIASNKNYAPGHIMRHKLINEIGNKIDVFGPSYNPIDYKLHGLKDYMFSVTIENCQKDIYFTEKLLDCFLSGVVPIYWGCPSIEDFFNPDGIIMCNNKAEIVEWVERLESPSKCENYYNLDWQQKAIKENFQLAQEYICSEDFFFEKVLRPKGIV